MHGIGEGAGQELQHAKAAIVLIAIGIVVFWRVLLRLLLALIAIAIMVTLGAGALVFLQK
ncbi:MAG TPA: hypothetical protein VEL03_11240 [Streptosporangiaceae bacterium]|nr:hypothetical protein [Streptosporangiaceae bacterium]